MPGHHVHFNQILPSSVNHQSNKHQGSPDDLAMLKFPGVKNILWDHTSIGEDIHVSLSYYRKPKVYISEKVLRFTQRQLESTRGTSCSCALQGSISVTEDGEGVIFVLDGFDPGGGGTVSTNGLAPGDISVPFQIFGNTKEQRQGSADDYFNALKLLKQKCYSKDSIELSNFLLAKGWCSYYTSGEKSVHHLDFDVVSMGTEFKVTPIATVPIVPTALSKNLSGPMSLSHLQGEPKTGYLTMDHTRKVLLVLESDPKVFNLPLVGIWMSGVPYVYSTFAWACFLRYIYNSSIHDRVCAAPEPFLLVLYSPMHSKPEFYEVTLKNDKMQFDLFTGYEVVSLPKTATNTSQNNVELDLSANTSGKKREVFDAALHEFYSQMPSTAKDNTQTPSSSGSEDITPRLQPAPHKSQLPKAMPVVPEVSLLFGDDSMSGVFSDSRTRQPPIVQGKPNGVHHVQEFISNNSHHVLQRSQSSHNPPSGPQPRPPVLSQSAPNLQNQFHTARQQPCSLPCCANQAFQGGKMTQNYLINGAPHKINDNTPVHTVSYPQPSNVRHHSRSMTTGSQRLNLGQSYLQNHQFPHPVSAATQIGMPKQHNLPVNYGISHQPAGGMPMKQSCSCPDCQYNSPFQSKVHNGNIQYTANQPVYGRHAGPSHIHQPDPRISQPRPVFSGAPILQNAPIPHPSQAYPTMSQSVLPQHTHNHQMNQQTVIPQSVPPTQIMSNIPQTTATTDLKEDSSKVHPKLTSSLSPRGMVENTTRNSQADSSERSSDDSGFSVTPERAKGNNSTENLSDPQAGPSVSGGKGINWNQVPPEVYQLLMQQDAQLKQLQAQIQTLMQNQSLSTQCTTMTELNSTGKSTSQNKVEESKHPQMCTIGVNTTLLQNPDHNSVSLQTSPVKKVQQIPEPPNSARSNSSGENITNHSSGHLSDERSSHSSHCSQHSQGSSNYESRTPAEIRHRGFLPMNSTEREDFDMDMSQGELSNVANNVALHNKTMDSIHSDMIVDMPSYHSSPSRSQVSPTSVSGEISQSPISASMCDQQQYSDDSDGEDGAGEECDVQLSADNKEYYDKLMENIHKLLQQQEDSGMNEDVTNKSVPNDTMQQSIMLGQYLNSMRIAGGQNPVETTFIPKINYMSMMFDSDSDCSMEINAMAMKYLKDEQLTQLTKLQTQSRLKGNKDVHKNNLLRQVLGEGRDATPNVTTTGMSPNDMTFATRKYLEKHGLLNDNSSTKSGNSTDTTLGDSYELKVNFSTVNSAANSPGQASQDIFRTPVNRKSRSPFLDSLRSQDKTGSPFNNGQHNIQGSPFLNSQQTLEKSPFVNSRNTTDKVHSPFVESNNILSKSRTPIFNASSEDKRNLHNGSNDLVHDRSKDRTPLLAFRNETLDNSNKSTPNQRLQQDAGVGYMPSPARSERGRVLSPIAQEEYAEATSQRQANIVSHKSNDFHSEDDKILDITRLKMMPKLL